MGECRVAEVRACAKDDLEEETRKEILVMRKQHIEEMGEMRKKDEQYFEEERQNLIEDYEDKLQKYAEKERTTRENYEKQPSSLRDRATVKTEEHPSGNEKLIGARR